MGAKENRFTSSRLWPVKNISVKYYYLLEWLHAGHMSSKSSERNTQHIRVLEPNNGRKLTWARTS